MTLTLDTKTQSAAETALAGSGTVANSAGGGMNRALLSHCAPVDPQGRHNVLVADQGVVAVDAGALPPTIVVDASR
jgi:hypothetical protein